MINNIQPELCIESRNLRSYSFRAELDNVAQNISYKLEPIYEMTEFGPRFKEMIFHPVCLDDFPEDGSLWLIPAYINNERGERILGIVTYDAEQGKMTLPKISDDGLLELSDLTGFGNKSEYYNLFFLIKENDTSFIVF